MAGNKNSGRTKGPGYVIRSAPTGSRRTRHYQITVPPGIAQHIPSDQRFGFELTDEGMLYRALKPQDLERAPMQFPDWAKREES